MASKPMEHTEPSDVCAYEALTTLVATRGCGTHPYVHGLLQSNSRYRDLNLVDAIHHLAALHGRLPGLIEDARRHSPSLTAAAPWFREAAEGFAQERLHLARLLAHGPAIPATPTQAEYQVKLESIRQGLTALAQSSRPGCAFGSALALVLDWQTIHRLLNLLGQQLDLPSLPLLMPDAAASLSVLDRLGSDFDRAIIFGATELIARHERLWTLLEDRQAARQARDAD